MSFQTPTSIQYLKGVGPARVKLFAQLGVSTVEDFLYLFPRRYEDRRQVTPIASLEPDRAQTVYGTIHHVNQRRSFVASKNLTEIVVDDRTGRMNCVWFNQPYLNKSFRAGQKLVCYGKVGFFKGRLQMAAPEFEIITDDDGDEQLSMQRIVPIYPLTRGLSQKYLRKLVRGCLADHASRIGDELPLELRQKYCLGELWESLRQIHFPDSFETQEAAMRRISFEEFYFFQVSVLLRRQTLIKKPGFAHLITDAQTLRFLQGFPFDWTTAQKRVLQEIRIDMSQPRPMLRLLQGDVGCGKTVVALYGAVMAARQGCQAAIMAPTEILARQHYENIQKYLLSSEALTANSSSMRAKMPFDSKLYSLRVDLLVGNLRKSERNAVLERIKTGETGIVIGTHALINDEVAFKKLSYVVIDEQHKFGVRQRALLSAKGMNPDTLIMTATPIPRTLCLTLYGDLDVSVINEMPPGRGRVITELYDGDGTGKVYEKVRQALRQGRQAYIIFPLVEESEDVDLKAAETMFQLFKKSVFKEFCLGLVHGRLGREEIKNTMRDFKEGSIQLLVATTVLEVGVDVTNATVMVVEHAQRFGLAQLHQLRGRIGRGAHDGLCLLIADKENEDGRMRLEAIVSTTDGFVIAQKDLEIRGPGYYFGRHQHGINELRIANPAGQMEMLELARAEAKALMVRDPELQVAPYRNIRAVIGRRYPSYLANLQSG